MSSQAVTIDFLTSEGDSGQYKGSSDNIDGTNDSNCESPPSESVSLTGHPVTSVGSSAPSGTQQERVFETASVLSREIAQRLVSRPESLRATTSSSSNNISSSNASGRGGEGETRSGEITHTDDTECDKVNSQLTVSQKHSNESTQTVDLKRKMGGILQTMLKEDAELQFFSFPVTEKIAPGYFKFVSTPMDYSTVRKKIDNKTYCSMESFERDVLLIYTNCEAYNEPTSGVVDEARRQREVFQSHMRKAHRLDPETKRKMLAILKKLEEEDRDGIFSSPVTSDVAPDYLAVIAEPMDFSTIRENINSRKYCSIQSFERDVHLIYSNCETYNLPSSDIAREACRQRAIFSKLTK